MKIIKYFLLACLFLCHPPQQWASKLHKNLHHHWPVQKGSSKQMALGHHPLGKQKTLVVQIRSDQPVPLVLKGGVGGPAHLHSHGHLHAHSHSHPAAVHIRNLRPVKISSPIYFKSMLSKPSSRKPVKIKLHNSKGFPKPASIYESPFKYEMPNILHSHKELELQSLPLETSHDNFISEHFSPIHTVPAPNLGPHLHDNHLHSEDVYLPPKPQPYHQKHIKMPNKEIDYQVVENGSNDQTLVDPLSGSQKLFAPDPDPSLPRAKIRLASEPFNQPTIGNPLPPDVQSNALPPIAQPLVQIVGVQQSQQTLPEIYPIQFSPSAHLQPLLTANIAAFPAAPIPIYNPTYLVTQSNNLYSQHKQQLFKPNPDIVEVGYVNADLTQQVASDGQILQAAKDIHSNIQPAAILDNGPQFAALIAAPALSAEHHHHSIANEFVAPSYYSNVQDSTQLLQAYADEEAQLHQLELKQAALESDEQQRHLQEQQLFQFQQLQAQQLIDAGIPQDTSNHAFDPSKDAFQQHERLVQQQLGPTPLRIFVPDEDATIDGIPRLQKRSDKLHKGTVEDADSQTKNNTFDDLFEVSTSVEVSSENAEEFKASTKNTTPTLAEDKQ